MKKAVKVLGVILCAALLLFAVMGFRVYSYRTTSVDIHADVAIVLGAAVWTKKASPVFEERINHAISLYRTGRVRKIIFTGGVGNPGESSESVVARDYAIRHGVSSADILIEQKSHTTYENILYAKEVADKAGLRTVLIVSDPLHMKRAMAMAQDVGFNSYPSPTPTTKYQSVRSQAQLLVHETYYFIGYLLRRPFLNNLT